MAINKTSKPNQTKNNYDDVFDTSKNHNYNDYASSNSSSDNFTLGDQSSVFSEDYSIISGGLMNITETMNNVVKNSMQTSKLDVNFIPLDRTNHDLGLDIILVTASQKNTKDMPVGVYALVISGLSDTLGNESVSINNGVRQYSIAVYPSQLFQASGVSEFIINSAKSFLQNDNVVFAGGSTIYTDNHDFSNEKEIIGPLVNAINACTNVSYSIMCQNLGQIRDVDLTKYNHNSETLEVERKLVNGIAHDFHGNPIRADWEINMFSRVNSRADKKTYATGSVAKEVVSITGYTDVVMVSPGIARNDSPWSHRHLAKNTNEQILMPVNVFTSILPSKHQSLNNVIFSLGVGIGSVWSDYYYAIDVLNPLNRQQDWPHSIAGLGYEVAEVFRMPEFSPFPTPATEPKFNQEMYHDILSRFFLESTSFAIEIAEGSPMQWIMQDFINAAFEDDSVLNTVDSANGKILANTNYLFGGKFIEVYKNMGGSGRVVFTLPNRRYLVGHYHNSQVNQKRSLQDIDRLFLDNQINGNRENLEFTRTLISAQSDSRLETQQAIGMQQEIVNALLPHAQIYGYGYRIEIDNVFAKALHKCMLDIGPRLINRNTTNINNHSMFATNIGGSMIDSLGSSILSNSPLQRQKNNSGFFTNNVGRRY